MIKAKIFYDKDYDNLLISQKENNEKVKRNFLFDDITISMTGAGKIVSIDITNVSNYITELGLNPSILSDIGNANIIVKPRKDSIFIGIMISAKQTSQEQKVPVANIPLVCFNKH